MRNWTGRLLEAFRANRNWLDLLATSFVFLIVVVCSMVFVRVGVKLYSSNSGAWAAALIWSFASLVVGFAAGFLFGIPKVLQQDPTVAESAVNRDRNYQMRVNTNLEQISDWLTKIIVGVGLVQLTSIPAFLRNLGRVVSESFVNQEALASSAASFAVGLVSLFFAEGFLGGYTLTRLFLAGAFGRADKEALDTGTVAAPTALDVNYKPSVSAKKILITLWRHQDKANRNKRWTFTVLPASPDYPNFELGVAELFQQSLIALTPEGQVMLSDKGFEFVETVKDEYESSSEVYRFD